MGLKKKNKKANDWAGETATLGATYRDTVTGFEGVAIAKAKYLYACERVTLQKVVDGEKWEIKELSFDLPALVLIPEKEEIEPFHGTGGPGDIIPQHTEGLMPR